MSIDRIKFDNKNSKKVFFDETPVKYILVNNKYVFADPVSLSLGLTKGAGISLQVQEKSGDTYTEEFQVIGSTRQDSIAVGHGAVITPLSLTPALSTFKNHSVECTAASDESYPNLYTVSAPAVLEVTTRRINNYFRKKLSFFDNVSIYDLNLKGHWIEIPIKFYIVEADGTRLDYDSMRIQYDKDSSYYTIEYYYSEESRSFTAYQSNGDPAWASDGLGQTIYLSESFDLTQLDISCSKYYKLDRDILYKWFITETYETLQKGTNYKFHPSLTAYSDGGAVSQRISINFSCGDDKYDAIDIDDTNNTLTYISYEGPRITVKEALSKHPDTFGWVNSDYQSIEITSTTTVSTEESLWLSDNTE